MSSSKVGSFQRTFKRLNQEASLYRNMANVVSKMNKDEGLESFYSSLTEIFSNEMKFTYGVLNGIPNKPTDFDLKEQMLENLYIFKENFKVLVAIIIEDIFKGKVLPANFLEMFSSKASVLMDQPIIKEVENDDSQYSETLDDEVVFEEAEDSPAMVEHSPIPKKSDSLGNLRSSQAAETQKITLKPMEKDPSVDPGEENSDRSISESDLKASPSSEEAGDSLKRPASKRSANQPLISLAKMPSNERLLGTTGVKPDEKKYSNKMRRENSLRAIDRKPKEEPITNPASTAKTPTRVTSATVESHRRLKEKVYGNMKELISSNQLSTTGGPSNASVQTTLLNTSISQNKKSFKDKSLEESLALVSPKSDLEKALSSSKKESKAEQKAAPNLKDTQEKARSISERPKKLERLTESTTNSHAQELEVKDELENAARRKKRSVVNDTRAKRSGKMNTRTDKTPDASFVTTQKAPVPKQTDSKQKLKSEESIKLKQSVYENNEVIANNSMYMKLVKNAEKPKEEVKPTATGPVNKDALQKTKKRK